MKIYISKGNLEAVEKALKIVQDTIPSKKKFPKEEKEQVIAELQDIIEKHALREQKDW